MPTYSDALESYVRQTFAAEDEVLARIREQITASGLPGIMIRPEEAAFLQFLVVASGARLALEIGTLGGYSGTWIARGLPPDGRLITLEVEPKHAAVARAHFKLAGVEGKVDLREGYAQDLLLELASVGPFDFVFIDADKEGYLAYLDWTLDNLRSGGILAAHNAFAFGGKIADPSNLEEDVQVIRQFNQRLADDRRLVSMLFPAGDGIVLAALRG